MRATIQERCRDCGEMIRHAGKMRSHEGRIICMECKARRGREIPVAQVVRPPSWLRRLLDKVFGHSR